MRFYITIGACNLSVWLVVFHSFHIVRYIFWGQVEVLSMVTGKPKTLAKLSGSKSDKTYICPKMQALPIMPKSLEVSTKRSRDGMWRWVENITSHHCNDRHCVQGHHVMLAALDTSSSKDLVEMAVPWYHGPSFMGGNHYSYYYGYHRGCFGGNTCDIARFLPQILSLLFPTCQNCNHCWVYQDMIFQDIVV